VEQKRLLTTEVDKLSSSHSAGCRQRLCWRNRTSRCKSMWWQWVVEQTAYCSLYGWSL